MNAGTVLAVGLGLVFIPLKLTNLIAWSWLWVLAPIWIPASLTLLILMVIAIVAVFGARKLA